MRDIALLRLFLRMAFREPTYLVASILLLALGIGALGAMLSLYRGTLDQPPPLGNWQRLLVLRGASPQAQRLPLSFPDFEDLRRDVPGLQDLALTRATTLTLEIGNGLPIRIAAARVTPNLDRVLGIRLKQGSGFSSGIGQPAEQAVISDRLYRQLQESHGSAPDTVRVGGRPVEIVGVLPVGVRFPTPEVDLWVPLVPTGNEIRRDYAFTTPWGLLRQGTSLEQLQAQVDRRVAKLVADFPTTHSGLTVLAAFADDDLLAPHRPLIAIFSLVGALVLIGVAANLAALAAARQLARRGDLVTRLALGASAQDLRIEILKSQLLPAAISILLGVFMAWSLVRAAEASDSEVFTALRANSDLWVITGTIAGGAVLLFAQWAPAFWMLQQVRGDSPGVVRTRATTADRAAVRGAGLIVILQIAMGFATIATLVTANRAMRTIEQLDLGFDSAERYSAALGVPELDHAATVAGFEAAIREVEQLPGFEDVAVISRLPLLHGASSLGLVPASVGLPGDAGIPIDARLTIGPVDRALGLRLLSGRFLSSDDRAGNEPVTVVDRRFVAQFFNHRDPLGARIRFLINPEIEWTIVGVVESVRWRAFEDGDSASLLVASAQFDNIAPMRNGQLVWRGAFDPGASVESLREALRIGMPLLSADAPKPLDALVHDANGQARLAVRLLKLLALTALLLALLGVGALLLYRHERQRRAVAIRICLGARTGQVIGSVLLDSVALTLAGSVAGSMLVLALILMPNLQALLPSRELSSALVIATVVMSLVAALGMLAPAWRLARLNPAQVVTHADA